MIQEPVKSWLNECLDIPDTYVKKTCRKAPSDLDRSELESVAFYALAEAAERYPAYCKENGYVLAEAKPWFRAFCARRVEGSLLDLLRKIDPVPKREREVLKRAGSEGSKEERAKRAGVSVSKLESAEAWEQKFVSMDSVQFTKPIPVSSPDLPDPSLQKFATLVAELPKLQKLIVALHYVYEVTLQDIAVLLELPRKQIWEQHDLALTSLLEDLEDFFKANYTI